MEEKHSHLIQKQANAVIYLTIIVLLLLAALFVCVYNLKFAQTQEEKPTPFLCGNAFKESRIIDGGYENTEGRKLFKQNCMVCHALTDQKITGPGLKDVANRVPQPTEEWLTNYILNNEKVRKAGDPYALKIYNENDSLPMTVFDSVLTQQQVKSIVNYISQSSSGVY